MFTIANRKILLVRSIYMHTKHTSIYRHCTLFDLVRICVNPIKYSFSDLAERPLHSVLFTQRVHIFCRWSCVMWCVSSYREIRTPFSGWVSVCAVFVVRMQIPGDYVERPERASSIFIRFMNCIHIHWTDHKLEANWTRRTTTQSCICGVKLLALRAARNGLNPWNGRLELPNPSAHGSIENERRDNARNIEVFDSDAAILLVLVAKCDPYGDVSSCALSSLWYGGFACRLP